MSSLWERGSDLSSAGKDRDGYIVMGFFFPGFVLFFGLTVLAAAFFLRLWLLKIREYRLPMWFFGFGLVAVAGWCLYVVTAYPVHISEKILHQDTLACFLFAGTCGYLMWRQAIESVGKEKKPFDRRLHAKVFLASFFFFSLFVFALLPLIIAITHTLQPIGPYCGVGAPPKQGMDLFIEKLGQYLSNDRFMTYFMTLPFILAAYFLTILLLRLNVQRGVWGAIFAPFGIAMAVSFPLGTALSTFWSLIAFLAICLLSGAFLGLLMWKLTGPEQISLPSEQNDNPEEVQAGVL